MPLDPNIALQAGQGVAAPPNPLQQFGQTVGIANALQSNKLMQQGLETQQQALAATRLRAMGGIAATALSRWDEGNPGQMVDALHMGIDAAVSNGTLDRNTAQQLYQGIAQTQSPQDLLARVKQFALVGIDPNAALSRVYGENTSVTNGQDFQPGVAANPMFGGGFRPAGAAIPQFPSRSELNERTIIGYDPKGNPVYGPKANVTPPGLGGPASNTPSPFGDGRGNLPPALRGPGATPEPPKTGAVTAPGPAAQAAQTATGGQSATQFGEIAQQGTQAVSQDAILANMQAEADQFSTGAGQDRIKKFAQFSTRFAPGLARAFGVDEKTLAANESFDKLAAQIADAQGAKSDARLSVTQAANPSSSLSPDGVRLILNQLRGNADYLKARAALAAKWPDKADHQGFEQVAKGLDPRVFQLARMTAAQRTAYAAKLNDADKQAIAKAGAWAREQGLLP